MKNLGIKRIMLWLTAFVVVVVVSAIESFSMLGLAVALAVCALLVYWCVKHITEDEFNKLTNFKILRD